MNKNIIIFLMIIFLIILFIVIPFAISIYLYKQYFGIRYQTYEPFVLKLEEFPGLKRDRYEFTSNEGQKLIGYHYYHNDENIKGIIIIAHGFGGGGHNSYIDCANYFAKNGYYVFGYDITGNDESEGESVNGLPQGVIDLDHAISFVQKQEKFKNLPIMLFGHSWGGYSVANVLNYHPEVKAIVSLAGFNKSSDLVKSQGEVLVGDIVKILMPYVKIYEKIKFGEYATNTAMSGFEKSNAGVMIVHSKDDDLVQKKYGYDIYYEKYSDSPRFKFISYEDKGHDYMYCSYSAINYINQLNEDFDQYLKNENIEYTSEVKAKYIKENLDRNIWINIIDEELFSEIVKFYDSNL